MIESFIISLFALISIATPLDGTPIVSKIKEFNNVFRQIGQADPTAIHQCGFPIKLSNLDRLEQYVNEVSFPSRSREFLSRREVGELVSSPASTAAVTSFLSTNNITINKKTLYGEILQAEAPIWKWEQLLNAKFYNYQRIGSSSSPFIRALDYIIPKEISDHVIMLLNIIDVPSSGNSRIIRTVDISEASAASAGPPVIYPGSVTPQLINNIYGIPSNIGNNYGSQSVYESISQVRHRLSYFSLIHM
jgi:hypothetical protein